MSSKPETLDHSIRNCVRPIELAKLALQPGQPSQPSRPSFGRKASPISVALGALLIYLSIALVSSQIYAKLCSRAADALPTNADVLVAGSSVISIPMMLYEFPKENATLLADRYPIIETPKFERVLSSHGAPNTKAYNSSSVGQFIDETEEFVQGFTDLKKHPRLLVLFVAPVAMVGGNAAEARIFLADDIENIRLKLKRNFDDFRAKIHRQLKHLTVSVYSLLNLRDTDSTFWQRIQSDYKRYYSHGLSKQRLSAFARILKICKTHSIKTLVVSTPLTENNRAIMSDGSYDNYVRTMREIVRSSLGNESRQGEEFRQNDGFIDFGRSPEFIESLDFKDPAHCNANGCEKMLQALAPIVVQMLNNNEH